MTELFESLTWKAKNCVWISYIRLETKSCRILPLNYGTKYDGTWFPTSIRLETKSRRILPLTYGTKYDMT